MKNPHLLLLSVSLPTPPPETVFFGGLPLGAIEAVKAAYGLVVQILDPPRDGFNLTVKLNLTKLPPDEGVVSLPSMVTIIFLLATLKYIESVCVPFSSTLSINFLLPPKLLFLFCSMCLFCFFGFCFSVNYVRSQKNLQKFEEHLMI